MTDRVTNLYSNGYDPIGIGFRDADKDDYEYLFVRASIWKLETNPDDHGTVTEGKRAKWQIPTGIKEGQKLYIWFCSDQYCKSVGLIYQWHSENGVPGYTTDQKISVNAQYDGSGPAWVMTDVSILPGFDNKDKGKEDNGADDIVYLDTVNSKVTISYKAGWEKDNFWVMCEDVFQVPPTVIKADEYVSVPIKSSTLGGFGSRDTNGACARAFKNVVNDEGMYEGYFGKDGNSNLGTTLRATANNTNSSFSSETETYSRTISGGKDGDTLAIIYKTYNASEVVFLYKWVEYWRDYLC
jgi:hypothetical protein